MILVLNRPKQGRLRSFDGQRSNMGHVWYRRQLSTLLPVNPDIVFFDTLSRPSRVYARLLCARGHERAIPMRRPRPKTIDFDPIRSVCPSETINAKSQRRHLTGTTRPNTRHVLCPFLALRTTISNHRLIEMQIHWPRTVRTGKHARDDAVPAREGHHCLRPLWARPATAGLR